MINSGGQQLFLLLEINWQFFHLLHNVRCAGFITSRKWNSKSATPVPPPLPITEGQKGVIMGWDNSLLTISTKQWNKAREEESRVLETEKGTLWLHSSKMVALLWTSSAIVSVSLMKFWPFPTMFCLLISFHMPQPWWHAWQEKEKSAVLLPPHTLLGRAELTSTGVTGKLCCLG